jgi:hypothetical protein
MEMDRRKFLSVTSAAGVGLLAAVPTRSRGASTEMEKGQYKYRLAFDVWINDVRNEAMPLENWPYGVLDDKTVDGIIRALDVQSEFGYNIVDLAGFWTTYAWPVDIKSVVNKDLERRVKRILNAAHERKMKVICFPSGILNWGFDEIIKQNPGVQTDNKHEMNPFLEESWQWQYKVFDYAADNYDIDGYHLEAADQGRCTTKECMGKWPNNVAYYCYVTGRVADHVRQKHPNMILITTIQGFGTWGKRFTEEETAHLVELSQKVDCIFDQGHLGTYIPQADWATFIPKLHCAYGTSGGIWVYPPQRWDRSRWFLPYTTRSGKHVKELYEVGGRGVMYYQGPVINPSTEVNVAFGGKIMRNVGKSVEDVLAEVLESLYRPKKTAAHRKLVEIFQRAENVYFEQWNAQRIQEQNKVPQPGELHLTSLFGATPGAASYLMEPYLDSEGRRAYKEGLVTILKDILGIEGDFEDNGRMERIRRGIEETLVDINNISMAKNEKQVWDDSRVGRRF